MAAKSSFSVSPQGCAEKVEYGLQAVLSYAMLVILGFAIIKVFNCNDIHFFPHRK